MARVQYQLLEMRGEFRCTRPYASVTAYREPEDHVPSTQVFGLVLAVRLLRASSRSETSLNLLDEVLEVARSYLQQDRVLVKVWPGLPLAEGKSLALLEAVRRGLELRGLDQLATFVSENVLRAAREFPYLLCLVPAPRIRVSEYCGSPEARKCYSLIKGKKLPLVLASMPFLLTEALGAPGVGAEVERLVRELQEVAVYRYSQGISVDRVRHTSRYGMFYAYGWLKLLDGVVICSLIEYDSTVGPLATDPEIETFAPVLSLGYKKSHNARELSVSVKRLKLRLKGLGEDTGVSLFTALVGLIREAVLLSLQHYDDVVLGVEAVDYVPYVALRTAVGAAEEESGDEGRPVVEIIIRPNLYYLQLTNAFYRVYSDGNPTPLAMPGSTLGFAVRSAEAGLVALNGLERAEREAQKVLNRVTVRRVSDERETEIREGSKILPLLRFKIMACGTAFIPFVYVCGGRE